MPLSPSIGMADLHSEPFPFVELQHTCESLAAASFYEELVVRETPYSAVITRICQEIVLHCASLPRWSSALKFYREFSPETDEIGTKAFADVYAACRSLKRESLPALHANRADWYGRSRCWEPVIAQLDALLQAKSVYDHVVNVLPEYLTGHVAVPLDAPDLDKLIKVIRKVWDVAFMCVG